MIQSLQNIFSPEQVKQAQELFASLSAEQRIWASGYLAGLNQSGELLGQSLVNGSSNGAATVETNVQAPAKLTILYGTHTGNSKLLALQAQEQAEAAGVQVQLSDIQKYKNRNLKEEENLLVIVSTHGEGDPPVSVEDFYAYIHGKKAPKLSALNFAVLALGDSSYINFCKTGRDIYEQLTKLGGKGIYDIVELDVDFQDAAAVAIPSIVEKFAGQNGQAAVSAPTAKATSANKANEWVEAEVLEKVLLNGRGSAKETYHIEIDIEETGIVYEAGDALEITAKNSAALVADILEQLAIGASTVVQVEGKDVAIQEALINQFELTVVTLPVLKKYADLASNDSLNAIVADEEKIGEFLYGLDFLDLIKDYPVKLEAQALVDLLRKLPARLYSISSSYAYNPDEVHVTVGAVRFVNKGRERNGVCSSFLADQIHPGENVWVRVRKNESFRLPANESNVIMVGPGTGIAPFRAFLQERETQEAEGKNWLFFGDQHFESDFLYQTELLQYRADGLLQKIDVAFSRDQEEKVYVQDRLRENGAEVFQWLDNGGYFYLCGDKDRMAKDVKKALVQIIEEHGKISTREAADYLKKLRADGYFREDVY
ncbi:assimilatory sulfite reductase (NADPH) flavoprotein subunit [Saccharicrinis aurantiacus]|uniref:assimilatory sulfite reductase (NADPH) flavoprotein subunit n=1 Tax=Saccharicrinis aurantiacus TaxID=1849719 RepID=UPI0024933FC5|nr:assimilatory sulfite reductase (NADPH) flavoprotein subunit [Saccharicrinis aurantiacus]